jgi:glutamate synthase (NADPH/NADH) large chain
MVELEDLDAEDVDLLHHLVDRHTELTASAVGRALLDDWQTAAGRFTKVMPRDYKNVLLARSGPRRGGSCRRGARSTCGSWTGARSTSSRTLAS